MHLQARPGFSYKPVKVIVPTASADHPLDRIRSNPEKACLESNSSNGFRPQPSHQGTDRQQAVWFRATAHGPCFCFRF